MRVGIITVPERERVLATTLKSLRETSGLEATVFVDFDKRGHSYNFTRMLSFMCRVDDDVLMGMDDVIYQAGWYEKVREILEKTDYDVIALFTNKNATKVDDFGVFKATSRFSIYDQATIYRKGVLCARFLAEFKAFASSPYRIRKERDHYDNMMSSFLCYKGIERGILRPNQIKLQNVPSTLGHNIVVKD